MYLTLPVSKISTLHSPITKLEHPFALGVSDGAVVGNALTQTADERLIIASS
jgi:hypothetical protein